MATFSTEISQFRFTLLSHFSRSFGDLNILNHVSIARVHRHLEVADFTIPVKCITAAKIDVARPATDTEIFADTIRSIPHCSQSWELQVAEAKVDVKSGILFKLNRPATFMKILTKLLSQNVKRNYFVDHPTISPVFVIAACGCKKESKDPYTQERNQFRCQLITQHLQAVCRFLGIQGELLSLSLEDVSPVVQRLTSTKRALSQLSPVHETKTNDCDQMRALTKTFKMCLMTNKTCGSTSYSPVINDTINRDPVVLSAANSSININLECILKKRNLPVGNQGYSVNLVNAEVIMIDGSNSKAFNQSMQLESVVASVMTEKNLSMAITPVILHVSVPSQSFHQQKVDLIWQFLSDIGANCKHVHTVLGPVTIANVPYGKETGTKLDLDSVVAAYEAQIREASAVKYREDIQEIDTEREKRRVLTMAAVKFDILSTAPGSMVKLDIGTSSDSSECKPGVFVLYNYARLATLFKRFESGVKKGTYPPLPAVEEINFESLKEEEEWKLLFYYVLQFPDVILETIGNILTTKGPACNINPHKISRFLQNLSHDFSIYYGRVHILVEPLAHLLPTMYARLFLLKAVMLVMKDGLYLLDIEPLEQM